MKCVKTGEMSNVVESAELMTGAILSSMTIGWKLGNSSRKRPDNYSYNYYEYTRQFPNEITQLRPIGVHVISQRQPGVKDTHLFTIAWL